MIKKKARFISACHTKRGAIRDPKVIDFSGGISALELPIITKLSPEGTAFTLPFNHPVDAISTAKCLRLTIQVKNKFNRGRNLTANNK